VSFEFLAPDAAVADDRFTPLARSPMERDARAVGARFEVRDGWNVAVGYTSVEQEREVARRVAGWADVSHLGKIELHAGADDLAAIVAQASDGAALGLGRAVRAAEAWWLALTGDRALVVCEPGAVAALRERLQEAAAGASGLVSIVDATTKFAALTILGPQAREVFARFTALDLRPGVTPVHGLRPGSIARTPGVLLREDEHRYLILFGAALGHYLWTVVADAAGHLGGAPVGVDSLEPVATATATVTLEEEAGRA
jgi:heterotetrameric sarcosine oxidase gamma subunit